MSIATRARRPVVTRAALARAVAYAWPFVAAMVAIKLAKLPAAYPRGLFASDLLEVAASDLLAKLSQSPLLRFGVLWVGAALIVERLGPASRLRRTLAHVGAGLVVAVVLSFTSRRGGMSLAPSLQWLSSAATEAGAVGALFWPEILAGLALTLVAALHFRTPPGTVRAAAFWCATALLALVLSCDAAYFVATRAEISPVELAYVFGHPASAFRAAHDGFALDVALLMSLPLIAFAVAAYGARHRPAPLPAAPATSSPALAWMLPLLAFAFFASGTPLDPRVERLSSNVLFRAGGELARWPAVALVRGADAGAAVSTRVPEIDHRPTTLVPGPQTRPYNVVLVLLESLRADTTTLHDPRLATTPFLAELASESLVVDSMYANVPRTSAAWVATLTGRHPGTVATMRRWFAHADRTAFESSLARQLRSLGYATGFFVPTHLDFENDQELVDALGFQQVVTRRTVAANGEVVNSFGVEDRALLPPLRRFLDTHVGAGRSFFVTIMTNVGHYPYEPPATWPRRRYEGIPPERQMYANSIAYADQFVREVVGELAARGVLDDTLLVVSGDHGEAFNEHGLVWHTTVLYEEGIHVPMLVRLPAALRRVGRVGGLRQQIDVLPTVADVLGLEMRGGRPAGRSLVSDAEGHRVLFHTSHFDGAVLALRDGTRKYLYHFGRKPMEVYDLATDPLERRDLAGSVPAADLVLAERDLRAWAARVSRSYLDGPHD